MKKSFIFCAGIVLLTMSANMGCVKSSNNPANNIALPDIANLSVAASNFVQGAASIITIASSTLGSGTFTVNYSLSGANTLVNQIATLVMSGGTGTFSTPALNNVSAQTSIVINSIKNSAGGSATPSGGNTATFSDSSGLMTATITGTTIGPTSFRATHVIALAAGPSLQIDGVMWTPMLTDINVHLFNYNSMASVNPFDISNASTPGGASYQVSGSSGLINDLGQTGTITISTVTPLFTGSFHYTNQDGSVVDGTFSCKTP